MADWLDEELSGMGDSKLAQPANDDWLDAELSAVGGVQEAAVSAEYDAQADMFSSHPTPEQLAGMKEPEPVAPEPAPTPQLDYSKLGDMLKQEAPVDQPAAVATPEKTDIVSRMLQTNPFAPQPVTDAGDMDTKPGSTAVDKALKWAGSRERFEEIKTKYEKPANEMDANEAKSSWLADYLDDIADRVYSQVIEPIAGTAETVATFGSAALGFPGSIAGGVLAAGWEYFKTANEKDWKLKTDDLWEAANHGKEVAGQLMQSTIYQPTLPSGQLQIETLMWPFEKGHELIREHGEKKGWSEDKTGAAEFGFDLLLAGMPFVKHGGKVAARKVGAIKAKMGKAPLTQAEIDFYMQNYRAITSIDALDRLREAQSDTKNVLRGYKEQLGIEQLQAFKDGTLGPGVVPFKDVNSRLQQRQAKRGEAAAAVEATKEAPVNAVDHILNNKGTVAENAIAKAAKTTDPVKKAELEKRAGEYAGMTLAEFEKKLEADIGLSEAVSPQHAERLARLKAVHAEWELKQAKANMELDMELAGEFESPKVTAMRADFDMDYYAQHGKIPTEAEFQTHVKNSRKGVTEPAVVENLDSRVQDHPLFQDATLTAERADVYNDPNVAKSVSGNPLVASHKLINDINQYLHGEKRIDIDGIRNVLLKMQDRAHEFKNYFISDADFESFRSGIDEAVEFAELARNPEAVPQRSIKDLGKDSDGVTLSAGFDPTLLKSAIQDAIELSKKLQGKLAPSVMRERINQLGKTREMDVTGINAYLDKAEKEGRKVTREEVLENMSGMKLEMEVNRTSYADVGRSFPRNEGYENHVYKWGIEDTIFNEAPGHYASHGSNVIFTTRVSREFDWTSPSDGKQTKAYVLEELQSDWWQKEKERTNSNTMQELIDIAEETGTRVEVVPATPLPFRESWGKNAVGFELINAIGEGASEFRVSTAETVLRGEGVINANQTIEGVLKDNVSDYRKSTINAIVDTYDRGVPKAIRQFFAKWGEKAEVERVDRATTSTQIEPALQVKVDGWYDELLMARNGSDVYTEALPQLTNEIRSFLSDAPFGEARAGQLAANVEIAAYDVQRVIATNPKSVVAEVNALLNAVRELKNAGATEISPSYYSVKIPPSLATKVKGAEVHTVKLNMGFDPSELGKVLEGTSKQMSAWFDKIRKEKHTPASQRMEELTAKFASDWIDIRAYSKKMLDQLNTKEGYEAYKRLVLISGAQTEASMRIKQARNTIYKGLNRVKRDITDQIIFARRIIAIDNARAEEALRTGKHRPVKHPMLSKEEAKALGFKQPVEFTADVAKRYLEDLERVLEPKDFADMIKRSELYFNTMRDALTLLKDRGIITPQMYGRLIKWDYAKRQDIMEKLDPQGEFLIGREPITVKESGVKTLREGTNADLLEVDSELMMADVLQATYGRIFRNDANAALRDIAIMTPDNGIARIPKRPDSAVPRGWSKIELFVDGKKEALHLENDFARSWLLRNREVSFEIARRNQVLSGTAILKPMATGINPEFAFANIARDLAHIWLTAQVKVGDKWVSPYSPHLPLAIPQMAGDLITISKDTFLRRGRWLDAVDDGMGIQFLTHEGRVWRKNETARSGLDTIQEIVGYINESSEILSRLMVRERAMKNYAKRAGLDWAEFKKANVALRREWKDGRMVEKPEAKNIDPAMRKLVGEIRREGSFIGRDYMDFSSHGSKGEYADTIVPYLNPGIQGTRGLFRAAKRNPQEFATKLAWVAGTTFSLYMANRMNNQEGMDKVSKQAKLNNWIIMTNTKITDANGVDRYVYYTIPKDPSQRYFTYMLDAFAQKFIFGEEVDVPNVMEVAASLLPVDSALGVTPTGNAVLAYYNIDAWRTILNKSAVHIWRQDELPDDQQGEAYIEGRGRQDTPEWAKTLGKALNVKPVIVEQMMGSYFTHTGNIWTWMSGKAFDEVFGAEANNARQDLMADAMSQYEKHDQLPMFRRFIGLTTSDSDKDLDIDDDITKEHTLQGWRVERELNWITQGIALGEYDLADLYEYKFEHPEYKDKIEGEIDAVLTLMNPDLIDPNRRSFWYSMRSPAKNAEKAERYYARYQSASPEVQNDLETERIILGYNTPDFNKEFFRILADSE